MLDGDRVAAGRILHLERGCVALHCAIGVADSHHIVAGIVRRHVGQLERTRGRAVDVRAVLTPLIRKRLHAGSHDGKRDRLAGEHGL